VEDDFFGHGDGFTEKVTVNGLSLGLFGKILREE